MHWGGPALQGEGRIRPGRNRKPPPGQPTKESRPDACMRRWALATTLLQVAIARSSPLLSKRRWMQWGPPASQRARVPAAPWAGCTCGSGHATTAPLPADGRQATACANAISATIARLPICARRGHNERHPDRHAGFRDVVPVRNAVTDNYTLQGFATTGACRDAESVGQMSRQMYRKAPSSSCMHLRSQGRLRQRRAALLTPAANSLPARLQPRPAQRRVEQRGAATGRRWAQPRRGRRSREHLAGDG